MKIDKIMRGAMLFGGAALIWFGSNWKVTLGAYFMISWAYDVHKSDMVLLTRVLDQMLDKIKES